MEDLAWTAAMALIVVAIGAFSAWYHYSLSTLIFAPARP